MSFDWKMQTLNDVVLINPQETLPKGKQAKKIPMDILQPFCRDIPSFEVSQYMGGAKFRNGDTIMARITPCLENGKIAKVNVLDKDEIGFGSTEYIVFRAKKNVMDEDFVYYLVCSALIREPAIKSMVGSSGRQRVQTDVVKNLAIKLPSLEEQRKIGALLKSLDVKIALNRRINDNLQQQGIAIVENYFTLTQSTINLGDLMRFDNGFAFQSGSYLSQGTYKVITIKNVQDGYIDSNGAAYLDILPAKMKSVCRLQIGDVLLSLTGNVGRVGIVYEPNLLLNQRVAKFVPFNNVYKAFLYFLFLNSAMKTTLEMISKGTAQQNLSPVETLKLTIPFDSMTIKNIVEPLNAIYNQLIELFIENKKLATLRDTLLPRLMSGEIDVSDVEI